MVNFNKPYLLILVVFSLAISQSLSQDTTYKYVVLFEDKTDIPYSLENPEEFMSPQALARRSNFDIELSESDLPINQDYVEILKNMGYSIISESNWLNAVLVRTNKRIGITEFEGFDFIANILWVAKDLSLGKKKLAVSNSAHSQIEHNGNNDKYGYSAGQIDMLNGRFLHHEGWKGEGMTIGVLDAGFANVPQIAGFHNLINENRLIGSYDFVENNADVYESSGHGTAVLSLMCGEIENKYLGTAPEAKYLLLKTEDVQSEQLVEEFNYVVALEYADQMGVDVINTSLGYTTFNHVEMNHEAGDLDGDQLIASKGADLAASKGMLIVNSAGNLGNSIWQFISIPADGDSVLAVGAVDRFQERVPFSGLGNPFIANIKPNVMAQGVDVAIINTAGEISFGGGTSFSGPIIAGLASCLWQAFPEKNNIEIMRAIEKSSSQFLNPDHQMGYGVPDFQAAFALLFQDKFGLSESSNLVSVFPNPFNNNITLTLPDNINQNINVQLVNDIGQVIYTIELFSGSRKTINLDIPGISLLNTGMYFLKVKTSEKVFMFKMIKV